MRETEIKTEREKRDWARKNNKEKKVRIRRERGENKRK
jgi:hypothetical protein